MVCSAQRKAKMGNSEDEDEIVVRIVKIGTIWEAFVDDFSVNGVGFSPVAALDSFCNLLEERRVYYETGIFTDFQTKEEREEEFEFVLSMTEESSDSEDDDEWTPD